MKTHDTLASNKKIQDLLRQSEKVSFGQGFASIFELFPRDLLSKHDNIEDEINKALEDYLPRYAQYGLLAHQTSPSIENYWKNVGSYLQIAIDDTQQEIDKEENNSQMKLL